MVFGVVVLVYVVSTSIVSKYVVVGAVVIVSAMARANRGVGLWAYYCKGI